jgi:hypothetical protein
MELHELTNIWNGSDLKMESTVKINKTLFMEVSINRIKTILSPIKRTSYFEIIVNLLFLFPVITFSFSMLSEIKYLIPGLLLIAFTCYNIIFIIKKLFLLYGIDAQTPVLHTQKNLVKLKLMEIRERQMLYILIPLFSPVFLIVGAKAFLNIDLYQFINWLIAQTAASILIAALIVYILKKFPDKNLDRTLNFINEIAEVEKN